MGNRYYPISCYGKERLHVFKKKQPSLGLFSDVDLIEYLNTRHFGLAKLSMYVEKNLDLILNQFRGLFENYEVMATSKDYIEITRKGTNKWEAFCHLPVEDAIFIGDGENDLCILEKLNDTYVMEHAPESLKAYGVCVKSVAEAMNIESRKENVLEKEKEGTKATAASMVMDTLKKRGAVDEKSAVDVSVFKNLPYATSTISYYNFESNGRGCCW